jgi:hypothetical protein
VRQLTIYATGAGIGFSDRDEVEAIVAQTKPQKHGLRSIAYAVVAGPIFSGNPASSPATSAARSASTTTNGIAKEP